MWNTWPAWGVVYCLGAEKSDICVTHGCTCQAAVKYEIKCTFLMNSRPLLHVQKMFVTQHIYERNIYKLTHFITKLFFFEFAHARILLFIFTPSTMFACFLLYSLQGFTNNTSCIMYIVKGVCICAVIRNASYLRNYC